MAGTDAFQMRLLKPLPIALLTALGLVTGVVLLCNRPAELPDTSVAQNAAPSETGQAPSSLSSNLTTTNAPGRRDVADARRVERTSAAGERAAADVMALLEKPWQQVLARDVPLLDSQTERTLIDRYHAAASPTNKHPILRVLALGGGSESVAVYTNAILREFAGYRATEREHGVLLALPVYLGVLGRREESAVEFLLAAVQPEFNLSQGLWTWSDSAPSSESVRGRCLAGLAVSGDPRARALFESTRLRTQRAFDERPESVIDAVFYMQLVDAEGLDVALDLLRNMSHRLDYYRQWKTNTLDGRSWWVWYGEVLEERRRRKASTQ